MADSEDRPIIVGGGPHMINVELPSSYKNGQPGKFSLEPTDPKMPFQEIIVWDGENVVTRWPLSAEWKIEIA
ncbi:MAG TPA: hypothetical protein VMS31_09805 [Pyrinomonadaceae bacterium]|nr:hypothetical protein [Pyrinomonadaceae bacterium]